MKSCPVIVIGHVDHGKTSLVEALTGMSTDRLPEEKARGLSIVPGFAYRALNGVMIDFIDAPGHADFIRAMISGASGARAALLVISAVEGVMPQTREHIQIAHALGIDQGIVAVTKSDELAEADFPVREADLRAALRDTVFGDAPFVFCASRTGLGLDAVASALAEVARLAPATQDPSVSFFPVDRVFVADGHGTIVTGTLLGGALRADDRLQLAATSRTIAIRGIQVRGKDTAIAEPGQRTALNLRGVGTGEVKPGDVLTAPGAFAPAQRCDCAIRLLPDAHRPVRHMEKVRVHFGSAHSVAAVRLLKDRQLTAGAEGFAQLIFDTPVCMFAGQRIILRSLSPAETVGGAIVLDPAAPALKGGKDARWETLAAALKGDLPAIGSALAREQRGVANIGDIARLARRSALDVRSALASECVEIGTNDLALAATVQDEQARYLSALEAFHDAFPLKLRAPRHVIGTRVVSPALVALVEDQLAAEGRLRLTATEVGLTAHTPEARLTQVQKARMDQIALVLKRAGLSAPAAADWTLEGDDTDLLALLIHSGEALQLFNVSLKQTVWLHDDAVADAAQTLRARFPDQTAFTTGEARAVLNTSRKYIVPLLEHFDALGLTVRRGDVRYMR